MTGLPADRQRQYPTRHPNHSNATSPSIRHFPVVFPLSLTEITRHYSVKEEESVGIGKQQHQSLHHQLHRLSSGFHCR